MDQIRVSSMQVQSYLFQQNLYVASRVLPASGEMRSPDRVDIGSDGITPGGAFKVVTERVLSKIQAVVEEARELLGVGPAPIDTSPEATADRIFNFATGFFETYLAQHPELDDQTARESFVDLVWGAVQQGIQEARDILTAIAPINDSVDAGIDRIAQILEERFIQFLQGTDPESATGIGVPDWSAMTM